MHAHKKLRIAYLSGPSEAADVYIEWAQHKEQNYFGSNYMKQFFEVCREIGADAYVITTVQSTYSLFKRNGLTIENRPLPSRLRGALYHLAMVLWFARLAPKLLQFRPDALIATANQNYWFLLFFLRLLNIPIIPSLHCVLWPKFGSVQRSWRFFLKLNRFFILAHVKAALVASKDIGLQLRYLVGKNDLEIFEHLPTYPVSQFASIASPVALKRQPFKIFFAGRIEANKGIYDLVEIARQLNTDHHGNFQFDICGDGGELDALRQRVNGLNLQDVIRLHGYMDAQRLSGTLASSHIVIVPTTSRFEEGFNMVCAEAILAGRPLITSAVCPALQYVKEAAIEVEPDNVDQYRDAILKLYDDTNFYRQKQEACAHLQKQFYDPKNGWAEKLKAIISTFILNQPGAGEQYRTIPR